MAQIYDFIIVGAGSAGCVLADRLTASGRHQVLLVEAGGSDRRAWIKVPVGYAYTFADPAVNWRYTTEADPGLDGPGCTANGPIGRAREILFGAVQSE